MNTTATQAEWGDGRWEGKPKFLWDIKHTKHKYLMLNINHLQKIYSHPF